MPHSNWISVEKKNSKPAAYVSHRQEEDAQMYLNTILWDYPLFSIYRQSSNTLANMNITPEYKILKVSHIHILSTCISNTVHPGMLIYHFWYSTYRGSPHLLSPGSCLQSVKQRGIGHRLTRHQRFSEPSPCTLKFSFGNMRVIYGPKTGWSR